MSSGTKLQAMEEDVKQSKTAVNANAAPAQPMEKLPGADVEDLGVLHLKITNLITIQQN